MRSLKTVLAAGVLLLCAFSLMQAQPGTLDNSFGDKGRAAVDMGESYDARPSLATLADGRTILVNDRRRDGYQSWCDFVVTRLLTSGAPDPTFGEGGSALVAFGPNKLLASGFGVPCLVQTDGKVMIGGQYQVGPDQTNYDIVLARFDTTGAPDLAFGQEGKQTLSLSIYADGVLALAQQADGKIILGGYSRNAAAEAQVVLVRCNRDGGIDSSFGGAGRVTTALTDNDIVHALLVLPDDRIIVAGSGPIGGVNQLFLARYTASGALDTSFTGDGIAVVPVEPAGRVDRVILHSDGSVTALCDTSNSFAVGAPFLVHLTSDGLLDTTYGTSGEVVIAPGQTNNSLAAVDGNGVVVAGVRGGDSALVLRRFTPSGDVETGFGQAGVLVADPGEHYDYGYGPGATTLCVRSTGEIVAAGLHVVRDAFSVALVQASSIGERDMVWGGSGRAEMHVQGGGNDYVTGVAVQSQGRILVSGYSSMNRTYYRDGDLAFAGFTTDGRPDPAFGPDGNGTVSVNTRSGRLVARGPLRLLPDGGIVLAGSLFTLDSNSMEISRVALARLTPNGIPDPSFGTDGLVIYHDGASQYLEGFDVGVQPDGRIVVTGYDDNYAILVRFHPSGLVDSTFGVDGKVQFGTDLAYGFCMLVRPGGEIVVGTIDNVRLSLQQFRPDGAIDSSFGTSGSVTVLSQGSAGAGITDVVLQQDGRIVLGGFRRTNDQNDGFVARMTANGRMDGTFGSGGMVRLAATPDRDEIIHGVAVQTDGRILASGNTGRRPQFFQPEESQPLLFRLLPDGSPDSTFGTGGRAVAPFVGAEYHDGGVLALQPDGHIILGIAALRNNNTDLGVMRIESGLTLGVEAKEFLPDMPRLTRNSLDGAWRLEYESRDGAVQSLSLVDMQGVVVRVIEPAIADSNGRVATTFTTDDLPRGVYLVRLMRGTEDTAIKLLNY